MKKIVIDNIRLIIICLTIAIVAIAGFSYGYAANKNTIYSRDELSEKVSKIGTIYNNSTIVNNTITQKSTNTIVCKITLEPGDYVVNADSVSLNVSDSGQCFCKMNNSSFVGSGIGHTNRFCHITSIFNIGATSDINLVIWQNISTSFPINSCVISAVRIK